MPVDQQLLVEAFLRESESVHTGPVTRSCAKSDMRVKQSILGCETKRVDFEYQEVLISQLLTAIQQVEDAKWQAAAEQSALLNGLNWVRGAIQGMGMEMGFLDEMVDLAQYKLAYSDDTQAALRALRDPTNLMAMYGTEVSRNYEEDLNKYNLREMVAIYVEAMKNPDLITDDVNKQGKFINGIPEAAVHAFIRGLAKFQRAGNKDANDIDNGQHDAQSCWEGSRDRITQSMDGIVKGVRVTYLDAKGLVDQQLPEVVKFLTVEQIKRKFNKCSNDEIENEYDRLVDQCPVVADRLGQLPDDFAEIQEKILEQYKIMYALPDDEAEANELKAAVNVWIAEKYLAVAPALDLGKYLREGYLRDTEKYASPPTPSTTAGLSLGFSSTSSLSLASLASWFNSDGELKLPDQAVEPAGPLRYLTGPEMVELPQHEEKYQAPKAREGCCGMLGTLLGF